MAVTVVSENLKMQFTLSDSTDWTISLASPKSDLTKSEIEAAMQEVIDKEAFKINNATPTAIADYYIRKITDTTF